MADQFATASEVKARIGITDGTDDTLLGLLCDEVTAWMQGYMGRRMIPETAQTYVFDTSYGNVLYVPRGVRTITTLGVASTHQPDSGGVYTTVPATDYLLRPKTADAPEGTPFTEVHISRGTLAGTVSRFSRADNGASIAGNFGPAAVPADLRAAAIDAVAAAYAVRRQGASGVIGADDTAAVPWSLFFGRGSPQRGTLDRYSWQAVA